ncbi:MAG TPA: TRAP transporter small permease [Rubrivivax sp.]|nr:TRAP transporter small permease [Rubrivivax sp.]
MHRKSAPLWTRLIDSLMAFLLALMVILVFGNVVLRYGFNSGISASEELSRYFFVWLIFLGAAVGLYRREHMGVNSFVRMLPRQGQVVLAVLGELLMLGCCGVLVVGSISQAIINHENLSPGTNLPVSLLYAPQAIAAVIMCIVLLVSLFRILTQHPQACELELASDEAEAALRAIEAEGPR